MSLEHNSDHEQGLASGGPLIAGGEDTDNFASPRELHYALEGAGDDPAKPFPRRRALVGGAVTAVLACALVAWFLPRRHGDAADLEVLETLVSMDTDEPSHIAWAPHPHLCWDVQDATVGKVLEMRACSKSPDKFILPSGSQGQIKWATNPEYCLDAPGSPATQLQLWYCEDEEVPEERMLFRVNPTGLGRILSVSQPEYCIDVPNESTEEGTMLQLWKCEDEGVALDMHFQLLKAIDCNWDTWSEWSQCSETCGGGKRGRTRQAKVLAQYGGLQCSGDDFESGDCHTELCTGHSDVDQAYDSYNEDKTNGIHKAEAERAMEHLLGTSYNKAEVDQHFDAADQDGDGELSERQFKIFAQREKDKHSGAVGPRRGAEELCFALCLLFSLGQLARW